MSRPCAVTEEKRLKPDPPANGRINILGLLEPIREASVNIGQGDARVKVDRLQRAVVDEVREPVCSIYVNKSIDARSMPKSPSSLGRRDVAYSAAPSPGQKAWVISSRPIVAHRPTFGALGKTLGRCRRRYLSPHLLPPVSMQPQRLQSSGFQLSPSVS